MSATTAARLFVAVDAPAEVYLELASWARSSVGGPRARVGATPTLRLLDPETMHVTLCFLGSRPVGEIEPIAAALRALDPAPVGELTLGAPLWLPPRRPRALAIELHDDTGGLADLRQDVLRALAEACGFQPERRRYRPHLTVARVGRSGASDPDMTGGRRLAATPSITFAPEALVFYRSLLAPEGARYEALETCALVSR